MWYFSTLKPKGYILNQNLKYYYEELLKVVKRVPPSKERHIFEKKGHFVNQAQHLYV